MPSVTGGGSEQSDGNPIITIDNTGTTNVELNISIDTSVAACMGLNYNTSWNADGSTGTTLGTTQIQLDDSYTPAEAAVDLYLWGNFTGCVSADATTRVLMMNITTV